MPKPSDGDPRAHCVALSGTLTLRNIEDVRGWLLDAIQTHQAITIDCAAVTEVDLSFLQLIIAARKSAASAGKSFSLAQPAAGAFLDTLGRAGLLATAGLPDVDGAFGLNSGALHGEDDPHRR
jgi:anti-anti-sigma regulatory factor